MAKKKKLELTWLNYSPGIQFTNAINIPTPTIGHPKLPSLDIPTPSLGNTDSPHSMLGAFAHYTGVPAMFAGGMGALGFNVATQAGQVKSGTSLFSAAKYGFTGALILEASVGTLIFAAVMTIVDPSHQWSGGLDQAQYRNSFGTKWNNPQNKNPFDYTGPM